MLFDIYGRKIRPEHSLKRSRAFYLINFVIMKKVLYLLVGILLFSACQTQQENDVLSEPALPKIISAKAALSHNPSGKKLVQYLEIKLDPTGAMPDLLLVKSRPLFDDGNGFDLVAGDNIYSSIDIIKLTDNNPSGRETAIEYYFKCGVEASVAGGECGGETCPDKTAWGFNTWFCVCFNDCSFCIGDDC